MRRTERLFAIIQALRAKRHPVTGKALAEELEISVRTLYRDMAELITQGVPIRGEAGMGYVIDSDYDMPPLMLTPDELEAAVLGAAWVAQRGDAALVRGATSLIEKLSDIVPTHLRPVLLDTHLYPVSFTARKADTLDMAIVRNAIRDQRKLRIRYADAGGTATERCVWPFMIGYLEHVRIIAAFCELRGGFRHFRTDRVLDATALDERFAESTGELRKAWEKERAAERARAEAPHTADDTPSGG